MSRPGRVLSRPKRTVPCTACNGTARPSPRPMASGETASPALANKRARTYQPPREHSPGKEIDPGTPSNSSRPSEGTNRTPNLFVTSNGFVLSNGFVSSRRSTSRQPCEFGGAGSSRSTRLPSPSARTQNSRSVASQARFPTRSASRNSGIHSSHPNGAWQCAQRARPGGPSVRHSGHARQSSITRRRPPSKSTLPRSTCGPQCLG